MDPTRRDVINKVFKGSVLCLAFSMGGATLMLTPEQARAQQVPLKKLTPAQVKVVEKLGEAIVPGSVALGLAHFLDHQLAALPENCLLIAKYLQAPTPFADFYGAGLKIAGAMSQRVTGKAIETLDAAGIEQVVKEMSKGGAVVDGFPIFLFYLCLRSDAVDVTYGTPEGFKKLNVPYMQHILPPETWNA